MPVHKMIEHGLLNNLCVWNFLVEVTPKGKNKHNPIKPFPVMWWKFLLTTTIHFKVRAQWNTGISATDAGLTFADRSRLDSNQA